MQTTLLGLAIAFILALIAALAGPLLVDWNRFRPAIEAEASRLIGAPVRVTGPIDAAILPTPSLTLHGIEAGPPDASGQIRARSLGIEFHLGPLMRGQWRAREMYLVGLDLHIGVTSSGQLVLPRITTRFDPEALSIERLNIDDGHATLTDTRSGSRLVLEKLWFKGDVRSLVGPFKGDGAFVVANERYGYRIAAGRIDDSGAVKVRLNVDPMDHPLAIDAEGTLSFESGVPRFEGALNLARPAGVALASGQTVTNEPWQLATHVKADAASALLETMEFQYGPDERAVKLTGTAELKFGSRPQFDGVISAGQIDFDRAFAKPDAARLSPFAAIKALGDGLSGALAPSIPARLGVSVDILTLAGATVHTLRGDLITNGDAWKLESFEFRAPGFTQVRLSGRLAIAGKHLAFTGPVSIDSTDPNALVGWLQGESYLSKSRIKPFSARGEVTFGAERIAVDRLEAKIDRQTVEGRLAYLWPVGADPARLDAYLSATELDLDALAALASSTQAATAFEMPRDVTLGVAADRVLIAGIEARQVSAQLRRDGTGLDVERLSVADFGGIGFDAGGHIDTRFSSPQGVMNFHLDARDLAGLVALAEKFAPEAAAGVRQLAARWQPTRLDAILKLEDAGPRPMAKLAVQGQLGAIRLSILGEASGNSAGSDAGNLPALAASDVKLQGKFEADEGSAIVDLLNLGKVITAGVGKPGQFSVAARGRLDRDLEVDGHLLAGGVNAAAKGVMNLAAGEPRADLHLTLAAADALPLRRAPAEVAGDTLPVTLIGNLKITSQSVTLGDFSGTFAGRGLRGNLEVAFDEPVRIKGRIEADNVDAPAAAAAAIGISVPPKRTADAWTWSPEPFAQGLFEDVDGRIEFTTAQANVAPNLVLRQVRGVARFSRHVVSFSDIEASLAGGRATGHLTFHQHNNGLSVDGSIRLANADAAMLLGGDGGPSAKPPIKGRLAVQIDIQGIGRSPLALVRSLTGNGTVSLAQAQVSGLDVNAFDVAVQAADQGMALDSGKVSDVVGAAFESGRLPVPSAEGVVTIIGGQVRLSNTVTQAQGAELTVTGTVDLIEGDINARMALVSANIASAAAERPVVFVSLKGPVSAPTRSIDVSAFTTWLTLRAVERQSRQLEAIEAKRDLPMTDQQPAQARTPASLAPASAPQVPLLPVPIEIPTLPGVSAQKPAHLPPLGPTGTTAPPAQRQTLPPPESRLQ